MRSTADMDGWPNMDKNDNEFDPWTVRDIARELYLQAPFDGVPYEKTHAGHESDVKAVLAAARSAGWEMVKATELEALRELVAEAWDDVGDAFIAAERTQDEADAIRKAKAAQR